MIDRGMKVLWKQLAQPLRLHGRGQSQEGQNTPAATGHFSNAAHDHQLRLLHHRLAHQTAGAPFGEETVQRSGVLSDAHLVYESGTKGLEQPLIPCLGRGRPGIASHHLLALGNAHQLLEGVLHLPGCLGVDAMPATGLQ